MTSMLSPARCGFVPPYLLRQIAGTVPAAAAGCTAALAVDEGFRARRTEPQPPPVAGARAGAAWTIHTADHGTSLPGRPVRSTGQPETGDEAVDEAAVGVRGTLALFAEVYGRASYDGAGAPVSVTVHYGRDYVNAFWDGAQLVFGDGDGKVFGRFTRPVDVLGHEFAHGVVQHTAGLVYEGQPGALNESLADVFAACLKQRLLAQTPAQADWLVGEGLFLPGVRARALRDMAAPGTAYDDPMLGKDPQVGHLDDYVDTADDNGGVHLNSGIPNRAFQLAATSIGGNTWAGAGAIWYAALTSTAVGPQTDFAGFAAATIAAAGDHAEAVSSAWAAVGVSAGSSGSAPVEPVGSTAGGVVAVRRSGGFVGATVEGHVDLDDPDDPDDDVVAEVRELVGRIDLAAAAAGRPHPDMYSYVFDLGGTRATVPEQHLTPELRRLADLLLDRSR
ncbi:protealysin inhibitor emfourin [Nocardioides sp.]|uniref:protealysin inhibitor emfourin n=1 Tax=Nocardioides sp. TaxID=35761 RepID=UPI002D80593E|nr:protealysin inhibitor emfourin [Nocardioides sp.]HET8961288.1 protealysin inhibitor emfourin [Nocardioides sp.]